MLMPKKVKYRKQQRGRMTGKAWGGSDVSFGNYGLKALEPCWMTARQIEAARVAMTRFIKRGGKIWARVSRANPPPTARGRGGRGARELAAPGGGVGMSMGGGETSGSRPPRKKP